MLMPFIIMISTSLKTANEINSPTVRLIPKKVVFTNYPAAMFRATWLRWFLNSISVAFIVVTVSLFLNSLAGFAFARYKFRLRNLLFLSCLIGLIVPQQITIVPQFILMKFFPLAGGNNIFGIGGKGWIDSYPGLMINQLAGAFGIFLCRQFYLMFPKELDEASAMDGCSPWKIYLKIYLPLSGPIFSSLGILKLTHTWNDYIWPLVIINSNNLKTVQLGLAIFKNWVIEWELLMAATAVVTAPLMIFFLAAQRLFIQGIITSGVKQ